MKILVVIAPKSPGPGGTPYVLMSVDDASYADEQIRRHIEGQLQDSLGMQFRASPDRLVWIGIAEHAPLPREILNDLVQGLHVSGSEWSVLEDRHLNTP